LSELKSITSQLIEDCKKGKQAAYNQIYQQCAKGVYNAIWRIVRNTEEAEDILQDTFMSAFTTIQNFRGDASLFGWIKRIGINKSLNAVKKNKIELIVDEQVLEKSPAEEEQDWEEATMEVSEIKDKLNELPEGFRLVLTLYLFEDYTHREIAESLGISESTSKTQYLRGKKKLKELLMYN
jgi:RNA polymerase sigma-70 factor (ECF subfamily)